MHGNERESVRTRSRGGWRFGLAALIGALAGATLFPRPAKGRQGRD